MQICLDDSEKTNSGRGVQNATSSSGLGGLLDLDLSTNTGYPSAASPQNFPSSQVGSLSKAPSSPSPDVTDPFGMVGAGSLSKAQVTNNAGNPFSLPVVGNPSLANGGVGSGNGGFGILIIGFYFLYDVSHSSIQTRHFGQSKQY